MQHTIYLFSIKLHLASLNCQHTLNTFLSKETGSVHLGSGGGWEGKGSYPINMT